MGKEKGKPLAEFGTNYPEFYHKGKEAISKLLSEASKAKKAGKLDSFNAQVAGAFHKEGLGDIDLVWGKVTDAQKHTGYGLAHILDKRASEFIKAGKSEQEAQKLVNKFVKDLPILIKNGKVEIIEKRAFIRLDGLKGVVALDYKGKNSNKWILTFYKE